MKKVLVLAVVACAAMMGWSAEKAQLERTTLVARTLKKGVTLFRDRTFALKECPKLLEGAPFLVGPFADAPSVRAKVLKGGEITVISPGMKYSTVSQEKLLREQGFELDASIPQFQAWGKWVVDKALVWRKVAKVGEEIVFGKWAIVCDFDAENMDVEVVSERSAALEKALTAELAGTPRADWVSDIMVTKPDFAVYIPQQRRNMKKMLETHDTYNDHFQVIWDERRKILYAFWTQATWEQLPDHHTAFRKSMDRGRTWTPLRAIAGDVAGTNRPQKASWQQPMLTKSGRLYCLWSSGDGNKMKGIYSDDAGDTWSAEGTVPVDLRTEREIKEGRTHTGWWCNWQRPLRLGENGNYLVGSSRGGDGVEFWEFPNIDDDPEIKDIVVTRHCTGDKALKVPKDENGRAVCEEPAIMKLPDGRLFAVMRASGGAAVWSESRDCGKTWTQPEQLHTKDGGELIKHSVSPAPAYDWKGPEAGSGLYFGCFHLEVTDHRGPLFLVPGFFNPKAHQPVEFTGRPKLIVPRSHWNSLYASYTVIDGEGILWYPDAAKFYLLGKVIDKGWMKK